METDSTYTAFAGDRVVAAGDLKTMLLRTKARLDRGEAARLLIFEDRSGAQVDFDFRGSPADVLARVEAPPRAGPGRPRLGVVCREVSLLPRHWDWLELQEGGISVVLRRLVDEARARPRGAAEARLVRNAASRFMTAMAGDLPGYEEACRALFAGDHKRFRGLVRGWPKDVRAYLAARLREIERLGGKSR